MGGGFAGGGEEYGLLRVRRRRSRSSAAAEDHGRQARRPAFPCSINPFGEVGSMRGWQICEPMDLCLIRRRLTFERESSLPKQSKGAMLRMPQSWHPFFAR